MSSLVDLPCSVPVYPPHGRFLCVQCRKVSGVKVRALLFPAVLVALLSSCDLPASGQEAAQQPPAQIQQQKQNRQASRDPQSGLLWMNTPDLPREGAQLLQAIARGGPFRYSKDGVTFGNRERILPRQPGGYYREYTVPTPGENDRGARRIVCGGQPVTRTAECYYTADHYASFRRIRP